MTINSDRYSSRFDLLKADHEVRYEIDFRDGSVYVGLWHISQTGTPFWIHHGHGLLGYVDRDAVIDATKLDEVFERITPQLDAVVASYESKWDGRNMCGYVDEEALKALEVAMDDALAAVDLRRFSEFAGLWEGGEWLEWANVCNEYGLSATSSDDELYDIAERIEVAAASEYVALSGLEEHLEYLRSQLQEEAAALRLSK